MKDGDMIKGIMGINIDLTDLKTAQKELASKEQLLNNLIDNAPIGIMGSNRKNHTVFMLNKEFSRLTGYSYSDIKTGSDWWVNAYPDAAYREQILNSFSEKRAASNLEGTPIPPMEAEITCKDGSCKTILGYFSLVNDYSLFFIVDITEKQKMSRQLLQSQKLFEQILRFLPDPTFAVDLEGRIIYWNSAIEVLTGAKAVDVVGKGNFEHTFRFYGQRREMLVDLLFHPDSGIKDFYDFVTMKDDVIFAEVRTTLANGFSAYLWGKASPLYDADGKIIGALESIRDITVLKDNEEQLLMSERKFRSIFETMPAGFFRTALDGRILELNPSCVKIFGYESKDEMISAVADAAANVYENPEDRQRMIRDSE